MKSKQQTGAESTAHAKLRNNSHGASSALAKRKQESRHNKQNIIELSESIGINNFSYPSNQFVHSKENRSTKSKSSLKDISPIPNTITTLNSSESNKKYDKEQELFDRRLSLKGTPNYSQQMEYQKSQRLSMVPLRREGSGVNAAPQCFIQDRQSLSSIYQQSLLSHDLKNRQQIKKEAIITNLVNKLQHEQDLRSIIESKLKNSSSLSFAKERRNQSYLTDYTEQNSSLMASKLKQCQSEIRYFKSVIKEMSERIYDLTEDKNFSKKKSRVEQSEAGRVQEEGSLLALLKNIGDEVSEVRGQARGQEGKAWRGRASKSFDFLDNIQRTLKILDNRKY